MKISLNEHIEMCLPKWRVTQLSVGDASALKSQIETMIDNRGPHFQSGCDDIRWPSSRLVSRVIPGGSFLIDPGWGIRDEAIKDYDQFLVEQFFDQFAGSGIFACPFDMLDVVGFQADRMESLTGFVNEVFEVDHKIYTIPDHEIIMISDHELDFTVIAAPSKIMAGLVELFGGDDKMRKHFEWWLTPEDEEQELFDPRFSQWARQTIIKWCWD